MYRYLLAGLLMITSGIVAFSFAMQRQTPTPDASGLPTKIITIAGRQVTVDLAVTPVQQERGLGGRDGLEADHGMLFVFPRDDHYAFWMKDMRFSIDMVWLSADGHVITITPNVSPDTYPRNFQPTAPARFVLELPAGFVHQNDLKIADVVQF